MSPLVLPSLRVFTIKPNPPNLVIRTRLHDLLAPRTQQHLPQLLILAELIPVALLHNLLRVLDPQLLVEVLHLPAQHLRPARMRIPLHVDDLSRDASVAHQQGFMVHHVVLARREVYLFSGPLALGPRRTVRRGEWRGVPLLETCLGLGPFVAEEEDVLFRDFGGEFACGPELWGKGIWVGGVGGRWVGTVGWGGCGAARGDF